MNFNNSTIVSKTTSIVKIKIIAVKFLVILLLVQPTYLFAKGTYQQPEDFISEAFKEQQPEEKLILIKGDLLKQVEKILQHRLKGKRIRYWEKDNRSVWVLEEIGKKKPITVGIIIDNDSIAQLKVLAFRETRGWEIRYPFFTKQFNQVSLTADKTLSKTIDGISGATLSVRALRKLANIALLLNSTTQNRIAQK